MPRADIDSRCYGHEPAVTQLQELRTAQATLDWIINNLLTEEQLDVKQPHGSRSLRYLGHIVNRRD